jgi:hypothetical protein
MRHLIKLVALTCAIGLATATVQGATTFRTVALTNQHAPGAPSDVSFGDLSYPVLNDAGQSAFLASLAGDSVTQNNNYGMWSEGSGSLQLLERNGDQAAGTPAGTYYNALEGPLLNSAGKGAFAGGLVGSGTDDSNNRGVWSQGSGGVALVARSGDHAPGTPDGVNFWQFEFNYSLLNDSGHTTFRALLNGEVDNTNGEGVWSDRSGILTPVMRSGTLAPGLPSGEKFTYFQYPLLNNANQVAFIAGLVDGGGTDNESIWSERAGSLAVVASTRTHAPGTPDGVNFGGGASCISIGGGTCTPNPGAGLGSLTQNNVGQTAFTAALSGGGVNNSNDGGIWSDAGGALGLVARKGMHAPGTSDGVTFLGFGNPKLNDAGKIAFQGELTGNGIDYSSTNRTGIWTSVSGSLQLVARAGDPVPGMPGVYFKDIRDTVALNNAGQIAFAGDVTGTGVDESNRWVIWATDVNGGVHAVVRMGDVLEVAPGDFRTISIVDFTTIGRSINNRGQLAFWTIFTDGSHGVFVSDLVAVPEPATSALLITGIVAAMLFRSRSKR